MEHIFSDLEYEALIRDIIIRREFKEIDKVEHHGTTRLEHSLRVSYYSYKLSKMLKLNSSACARAGLLHDFFMSYPDRTKIERFFSTFIHPKYALINATNLFELTDIEKNIIRSHMFPINTAVPKYLESWLVSFVDKGVAGYEFITSFKKDFKYAVNYLLILLIFKLPI